MYYLEHVCICMIMYKYILVILVLYTYCILYTCNIYIYAHKMYCILPIFNGWDTLVQHVPWQWILMTGSDRSVSDPFALCRFKTQLNSQDERNKIEKIEMTDPCHSSVANPLNSSSGSYSNSVDNNSIDPMSLTGLLASYFESQTWRSAKSSQRLLFTVVKVIKDAKIVQL